MQFRPSTIATIGCNSVRVGSFCGWFLVLFFFATITTEQNNGGGNGNVVVSAFTSSSAPVSALSVLSQWRSHPQHKDARSRVDAHMEPHSFALSMSSILVKDTTTTTTTPTPQRIRTISRDELIRRIPSSSSSSSTSSNVKTNTNTNTTAHSKYQIEFRQLLTGIIYTEDELACLRQTPHHRNFHIILTGIAASYDEPAVYRAFEILYEDYAPLRIAGRLVVHQLRKRMQDELVAPQTNTSTLQHRPDSHSPVDAVTVMNPTDPKRTKYNARYNAMIAKFEEWKPIILASNNEANGNGTPTMECGSRSSQRRFQILRGCFVGSDNPAVLEALRVIYVEYGALRVSGDWIYKVVSALMKPIVHRYRHQRNTVTRKEQQ